MPSKIKKGIIFAVLAACISGFSIFYNKIVVVKGVDSTVFNILKNGGTALILSMLLVSTASGRKVFTLPKSKWLMLFAIALFGGSIPFVLFFEGLKVIPAINANLVQKTLFIWVAVLAVVFLKEKLTRIQIAGYALVMASNFFIGGFQGFALNSAEGLVFLATLFWSVENIMAKVMLGNTDSTVVAWGRMFLGCIILLGYAIISGKIGLLTRVSPALILPILGSIILLSGYVYSWYKALSLAPVTVVTAILVLATPVTNILSAVFVTHLLDTTQLLNLTLSLIGIAFIALFMSKSVHYDQPRTGLLH